MTASTGEPVQIQFTLQSSYTDQDGNRVLITRDTLLTDVIGKKRAVGRMIKKGQFALLADATDRWMNRQSTVPIAR